MLFVSLGCDKNRVDSEYMLSDLSKRGYRITDDEMTAKDIKDKVNVAINEDNPEGVVRHFKNVQMKMNERIMSRGTIIEEKIILSIITFIVILNIHSL